MTRKTRRFIEGVALTAAALAAILPFVSFGSAGNKADIGLKLVGETPKKFTLGWTPPAGAFGYVYYADGKRISWTLDPKRSTATFWKGPAQFEVRPIVSMPSRVWTAKPAGPAAPAVESLTASADGSDTGIQVVSETAKTITLGWSAPDEVLGYVFYVDGTRVSRTLDPSRTQATFWRDAGQLEVQPIAAMPADVWSPTGAAVPTDGTTTTTTTTTTPATGTTKTTTTTTTAAPKPASPSPTTTPAATPAAPAPTPAAPAPPAPAPAAPAPAPEPAPAAPAPAPSSGSISAPSWEIREELNQTDPGSESGNRYTFGWVKSLRPAPTNPNSWNDESVIEFSDYPDEFVMIEAKRFDQGYAGRTTNFHLVGNETVADVSPLSADYHSGRSGDWPSDMQVGLVVTAEAELQEHRRGHWQLATDAEITADRSAVWTLVWRIRWRTDRSGYAKVSLYKNGQFVRRIDTGSIKTAYAGQQPRLYCWLGGYETAGLSSVARITQTLDYRGRTIAEALADRPTLGSTMHSVSTGGGSSSSISGGSPLSLPDAAIRANG